MPARKRLSRRNSVTDTLTPRDRVVLMALMAMNEEVTNAVLKERVGFILEGPARLRLNQAGYVDSRMPGRAYVHELTDKGWAWCWDEMTQTAPPKADSGTRSLYAVLRGLRRYLDSKDLRLADVFGVTETTLASRLRMAYESAATGLDDWVPLAAIRTQLGDAPRSEVDAEILRLERLSTVNLVPQTDQAQITPTDEAAALRIGGKDKHLLRFGRA
jgi:hypothetical protein